MTQKIKPFGKRLLVVRQEVEMESAGGIIIPDSVQAKKLNEGVILDTGEGCSLKAGTYVIFGDYSGNEIEWDGVVYLLIMEEDVIAFVEGE